MLKNNPRSIKKVLFGLKTLSLIAISPLSLISCTVDTPTTEYNHQVKILSSNDATYLLNRDYYDLILASGYRLSLAELRKRFKDTKSREFQDLLRAFRIWEQFNLLKDPLFFIKQRDRWDGQGLSFELKRAKLSFDPLPALTLSLEDIINLLRFDKITKIGNSIKEIMVVEGYLKSKKLDPLALSFKTNLRTMIKQGEFASNLIAYLLEHNPTIKFEFKSNDPLIVGVARYLKVDSIDSFNSLFKIIATSELSTKVSPRLIELLLGELLVKDRFVFGFKGVELNEAESSGDLSLDPLTLAQQGSLLAGFSSDGGKRLISLRELLISNLLKDKPKLKVVVKGGRSIDITKASLDVADYVFIGTETNKLTLEGNLSYQIKGLLKQADRLFAVVELSDTKGKKPSHPYLVEVVLDPNKTTTQGVFKLATSIQPQVESNSLLLQLIVRLTPALSFDKDGRASFSLDRRLRAPELITWLALLLLDRDSSLLTKAKIYYLNQGFVVKSEEPISRALVDSLGLN